MIKVSIIIPVYNAQAYIRECLDSLINQTLQEIEIICVNDYSLDSSLNILQEYAAKDDRIVIIDNEKNLGAGISRNIGMHKAAGEYLLILDADDFFSLTMVDSVYRKCINENADIGIYDYAKYNHISKHISNCQVPMFLAQKIISGVFAFNQMRDYIFQMISCAPWNKMYKRQFVLDSKIEFQDLKNSNDVYFGTIILTKAKRITYVNVGEPLLYYRTNTSTQISANRQHNPNCVWEALMQIKNTLIENDDFECIRGSFYTYVVQNLIYILRCTERKYQPNLHEIIQSVWLKELKMLECKESDFLNPITFKLYQYLKSEKFKDNWINAVMTSRFSDIHRSIELFRYLKLKNYRCGLWGIGVNGKAFLKICNEYNYELSCIIDEDAEKAGMKIGNYTVESFINASSKINAVIITNTHYTRDIFNIVNQLHREIKVIDVGAYYEFRAEIDECIF